MGPYQTNRSKIEAGLRLGGIYLFCWGKEFFAQYELYIYIQSNFTTLRSNIATENALQMKVLIGKFSINVGFSIATFDYQRVRSPYSPSSTPNKSPKTPKQTAERKPDVCDGDLNFGRQHGERVWQDGTCRDGWKGSFWPHMTGVYLPILCIYIYTHMYYTYIYI